MFMTRGLTIAITIFTQHDIIPRLSMREDICLDLRPFMNRAPYVVFEVRSPLVDLIIYRFPYPSYD